MRLLSIDSETELIRPGVRAPRLVCVSASIDGAAADLVPWHKATPFLVEALRAAADKRVRLVGHNICGFDLPVFIAHEPRLIPLVFAALDAGGVQDTKVNAKLYDRARGMLRQRTEVDEETGEVETRATGYSLDELSQLYLGRALDKGADGWRLRYGELRDVPIDQWPERARVYAQDDAIVTWLLYRELWTRGRALYSDLYAPAAAEARAAFALGLMTAWGIHTSGERIEALERTYADKQDAARLVMLEAGLIRDEHINPRTGQRRHYRGGGEKPPKWVRNTGIIRDRIVAAFAGLGLPPPEVIRDGLPTGNISTGARHLKQSRDPGLAACVDYARAQKILTTYVPLMREGVITPIQCGFDSVLETGRTSTYDPNLQNISKAPGVRECFVPRPGRYFCSVDFNSAELRSWGQACLTLLGHSRMADTFRANPNADPHLEFAANQLLGISYAEAQQRKKAKDPAIKGARHRAKAANFGFPGGMGAARFRDNEEKKYWETDGKDGLLLDAIEAEELRARWYAQWPEARPYFSFVAGVVGDSTGTFRGISSGAYRGGCGFSDGANNAFQELTAWGAKAALYAVVRACYLPSASPLYGSRVVIFAHDEVITEIPIESSHEAACEQTRLMVEAFQAVHPDVPVTAEPALMEFWSKQAEPAYDEHQRLIPWRDAA